MIRAPAATLCVAALALGAAGCGGSSGKQQPSAESYVKKPAAGYRYMALTATDEDQVRSQLGQGLAAADQLIVRRVLKGDKVAGAVIVARLKKGQNPSDAANGLEQKAGMPAQDVKISGHDAKVVKVDNLYAVYDTDGQTFLAVFAQTEAEARTVAAPVVR